MQSAEGAVMKEYPDGAVASNVMRLISSLSFTLRAVSVKPPSLVDGLIWTDWITCIQIRVE